MNADWWLTDAERPQDDRALSSEASWLRAIAKGGLAKLGLLTTARGLVESMREIAFLARSYRFAGNLDMLVISGGGQLLDFWGPFGFSYTLFKWVWLARRHGARSYFTNNEKSRWLIEDIQKISGSAAVRLERLLRNAQEIQTRVAERVRFTGTALPNSSISCSHHMGLT